jgi:hypothetical protein
MMKNKKQQGFFMVDAIGVVRSDYGLNHQELSVGCDCDHDNQILVHDDPTFQEENPIDSEESDEIPKMNVCGCGWTWVEPTWTVTYEMTDVH